MTTIFIFGLAVALAMDAFAVSIAVGINLKTISSRQYFRLSYHFGLFQAMMPIIGWYLGNYIRHFAENYAHWIAFGLLFLVGFNMLREALSNGDDDNEEIKQKDATRGMSLVVLSVATSIDALAVGLSLSMLEVDIFMPALIIGLVAGLFTLIGMHLGRKISQMQKLSRYAEILGGIVLLLIGIRILFENGVFS